MRKVSLLLFFFICSLFCVYDAGSNIAVGGERERQIISNCAQRGAWNIAAMQQCSGMSVSPQDFQLCMQNGPCMDQLTGALNAVAPSGSPQDIAIQCAQRTGTDVTAFAFCAQQQVILPPNQQAVLDCAVSSSDTNAFASCAAPNLGINLSDDQRILANCAMKSSGDADDFASCAGSAFADRELTPDEKAVLNCAEQANGDVEGFAGCSASKIVGSRLSREQRIAVQCAAQSEGELDSFATCAGANMFNLQLNPEQQIAVQCVVQTGGQPYAAAGCMASRLTLRELEKCVTGGFGGDGCFGDSNDIFGRNGWTARTMQQIAGGPNSVIRNPDQIWGGSNSFVRNPGQIWGGNNSIFRNPDQIWGGSNSFVRNPSQFWGGNNSVFNNPQQLIPQAPAPLTIGSVAGHRICIPWC